METNMETADECTLGTAPWRGKRGREQGDEKRRDADERSGAGGHATPRPPLFVRIIWVFDALLFVVVVLGAGLFGLWQAWQTGDWFPFWGSAIVPGMVLFFALILVPILLVSLASGG
jgi:hypothetical protein